MMEPAVPTTLMDRAIIRITNGPDAILANCTRMMMEGGDTFRLLPGRRSSKSRMETEMRIPLFHRCCQLCLFCLRGFYNNNTVSHSATIAQTTLSAFRWSCCLLPNGAITSKSLNLLMMMIISSFNWSLSHSCFLSLSLWFSLCMLRPSDLVRTDKIGNVRFPLPIAFFIDICSKSRSWAVCTNVCPDSL